MLASLPQHAQGKVALGQPHLQRKGYGGIGADEANVSHSLFYNACSGIVL